MIEPGRIVLARGLMGALIVSTACAHKQPAVVQNVPPQRPDSAAQLPDTVSQAPSVVTVRDPEMERRVSRLELELLEREAQVEDLQSRLDEATREVVRSMAKLQTLATRAEAASGMAEAEIAMQSLRSGSGQGAIPEVNQVGGLLQMSTTEFNKQNYGGALYLANRAKNLAGAGRARLQVADRGALRQGEVAFALPLRLQSSGRSNVREGPGTAFKVLFTLEAGAAVTAFTHVDQWLRISDETGRSGWIFENLIGRRDNSR